MVFYPANHFHLILPLLLRPPSCHDTLERQPHSCSCSSLRAGEFNSNSTSPCHSYPPSSSLNLTLALSFFSPRGVSSRLLFPGRCLSRTLLNSLHSLKAWVWSMAGRCVTRGTDAGLVYYSAISTSKTAKKGREVRGGDAERVNLAVRSKEWRTSQITRLLCDTHQPSHEFFSPRSKENLLVDEQIPAELSWQKCARERLF